MLLALSLGRSATGLISASLGSNHFPAYLLPVFQDGPSTLVLYGVASDISKYSRSADVNSDGSFHDYLFLGQYATYVSGSMGYPMADPRDTDEHRQAYTGIARYSAAPESVGGVLYIGPTSDLYRFFNVTTLTPLWLRLDAAPTPLDIFPGFVLNDDVAFLFDAIPSTKSGVGDWTSTGADRGDWFTGDIDGGILTEPITRRQIVSYNATSNSVSIAKGTTPPRRNVPGTMAVGFAAAAVVMLWITLSIDRHYSSPQMIIIAIVAMQVLISGATEATEILANYVGVPWWAISAVWYTGSAVACIAALYRVRIVSDYSLIDEVTGVRRRSDEVRIFYTVTAGVLAWVLIGLAPTNSLALLGAAVMGMLVLGTGLSSVGWGLDKGMDTLLLILGIGLVYLGVAVPVTTFFVPGEAERWVVSAYGTVLVIAIEIFVLKVTQTS